MKKIWEFFENLNEVVYVADVDYDVHAVHRRREFRNGGISLRIDPRPEYADVTKTLETRKPPKLSPSQLETLTVIAYYQPATKALVEQIRGVDSAYCVSALVTKKLIRECGRLNVPGRPIVYETTPDFLRVFGLESLTDLPQIEKVDLHVDPSQIDPIEQKPDTPQTEDQLPAQQEIPL